jgi:N-acetylmuramoyl-L-alanine amidase
LFKVQVGAFSERANAERVVAQLKEAGYEAMIITGPPHRVQTGAFSSQENAERLAQELRQKGFEAIVVR